jgi:23S rRNA (adenine2503-C2)-methyltransferase
VEKPHVLDLSLVQIEKMITDQGFQPYRAEQLIGWIFKKYASSYDEMTDLPKDLRTYMACNTDLHALSMLACYSERSEESRRYLWGIDDSPVCESVLLTYKYGTTGCLSTQVGCPVGCSFCASGKLGFDRNLTRGEIIDQLLGMCRNTHERIGRVVFMGTGEPFFNYDNVMDAIALLSEPRTYDMSPRRITISTVGIPAAIRRFAHDSNGVRLAVSLHASSNPTRDRLIPVNEVYPLNEVMSAVRYFAKVTGQRVTFEYMLLRGVNDSGEDALALAHLLSDLDCLVNLIRWNPVPGVDYQVTEKGQTDNFRRILERNHVKVTVRRRLGVEVKGACGQLRRAKS